MIYNLYKILFENQIIPLNIDDNVKKIPHFKNEWIPELSDWNVMIKNMNEHSSLHNIFSRIKNVNKLIRYYLIARALYWPGIDDYYNENIYQLFLHFGLTFQEIHILENENPIELIPEEINGLIENLTEFDKLGGIALRNQDLGVFIDDKFLFNAFKDIKDIQDIKFLRLPLDYKKLYNDIRIIEINYINGSHSYLKITKLDKNHYHLKTRNSDARNISRSQLHSKIYILLFEYTNEKIIDDDYTINWL